MTTDDKDGRGRLTQVATWFPTRSGYGDGPIEPGPSSGQWLHCLNDMRRPLGYAVVRLFPTKEA